MNPALRRSLERSPSLLAAVDGDLTASQRSCEQAEIRLASLRGPAHRALGEPRQDAAGLAGNGGRTGLALGVADGLGSVSHSHLGAQGALGSALGVLAARPSAHRHPEPSDLAAAVLAAVDGSRFAAELVGCDVAAVSTTLTVAWVAGCPFDDGSLACLILNIGDSSAYVLEPEPASGSDPWRRVFDAADPGLPSNVVQWHLPRRPEGAVSAGLRLAPGAVLLLCTDGVGDLIEADPDFAKELAVRWANQDRSCTSCRTSRMTRITTTAVP